MDELLKQITEEMYEFKKDGAKAVDGNKAAGRRSRKTSLVLARLFKEWRAMTTKGAEE